MAPAEAMIKETDADVVSLQLPLGNSTSARASDYLHQPPRGTTEFDDEVLAAFRSVSSEEWTSKISDAPPPGRALLEEVLSRFTEFAQNSSEKSARVGRGLAGAPSPPASWSALRSIEGKGRYTRRFRRYEMQTVDLGPEFIARPGTAPPPYFSPGSPISFAARSQSTTPGPTSSRVTQVSPTQDSPARDRLPRSAQQFPAIVTAGVTSSSMVRPQNQESVLPMDLLSSTDGRMALMAANEEDRPPFRHGNSGHLLERRLGPEMEDPRQRQITATESQIRTPPARRSNSNSTSFSKRKSGRGQKSVSVNVKDQHSDLEITQTSSAIRERRPTGAHLAPFADHHGKGNKKHSIASFLSGGPSQGKRPSKFYDGAMSSLNPNELLSSHVEEVQKRKTGPIWKLALHSSKDDRLERLNIHRKIKESEFLLGDRDKVVTREEVELAEDSFYRYYKKSTAHWYNQEHVLAALADFGIKARIRPEKLGLLKVLAEYEYNAEFNFKDFCNVVEEARVKMRSVRFSTLFLAWRYVDVDDIGALDTNQIYVLLESLHAVPDDQTEATLTTWIEDLHKDSFGLISLGEVEYLMQQCREHIEATRRRAERHIQEQYHLARSTFNEFRSQLIDLHDAFSKLEQETAEPIGVEEVMGLLADFGITSQTTSIPKGRLQELTLAFMVQVADGGKIAFPWLLMLIRSLRKTVMEERSEDIRTLFNLYDKDRSEQLEMKEICSILVDMNLQPKSADEQQGIAELLEEVDSDGSGTLSFEETLAITIRCGERISQLQRLAEHLKAEALGFSKKECFELRRAFEALDTEGHGYLNTSEVHRAVHWMQWRVSDFKLTQLLEDIDEDRSGTTDFSEFLELMRRVDDDLKASGDDRPITEQQKDVEVVNSQHGDDAQKGPDKVKPRKGQGQGRGKAVALPGANANMPTRHARGTVLRPSGG